MIRRRLPDVLVVGLLFILPLILFWSRTVGGKTLLPTENLYQYEPFATYREAVNAPDVPHNHLLSDLVLENYQWKSFIRQNIDAREIPLWNPHQFSGTPFMAAGQQSTLYPLSLLYYILPLPAAYGWFTVVNLWLAGVFMCAFVRGLGVAPIGGAIAGITYQLCGFFIASAVFPMILGSVVWLPLLLLMAEFTIRRQPVLGRESSAPWVAIGAGALGCNILAGHVEITIYTLLILAYYGAARLVWELWQWRAAAQQAVPLQAMIRDLVKSGGWLAIMVALGFGVAAIQFIPLFEFAQTNWRAERSSYDIVVSYAHPLRDGLQFALPNFYGSPAHHNYFDVFEWKTVPVTVNALGEPITHTEWGIKNYVEGALYVGILPLALAAFGLLDALWLKRNLNVGKEEGRQTVPLAGYSVIFALLVLGSLTFMFGLPFYRIIYLLPSMNQLNTLFRWVFGMTVGVAVLAGFGAHALAQIASLTGGKLADTTRQWARRFGFALIVVGMLMLAALLVSRVFFGPLESSVRRVMTGMEKADQAFADARMFYSYQFKNVLIFGLMTLGSGGVFLMATRNPTPQSPSQNIGKGEQVSPRSRWQQTLASQNAGGRIWQIGAIALIAADLMIASWGFNPASDPQLLDFTPPSIQWLLDRQSEEAPFRYTTLDNATGHLPLMQPNATMRYGLDDVRGYDSIISEQYVSYMRATYPQPQLDYNRVAPIYTDRLGEVDWKRLTLLNVRYLVTHISTPLPETLTMPIGRDAAPFYPVYEDEVVRIWRNPYAYERAFVHYTDGDAASLTTDTLPFIRYSQDRWRWGDATITRDTGREKFIDTRHERAAWLLVSETYAPGWRAFIRPPGAGEDEETELEVQRVLDNFQGVDLRDTPAGHYTIRMIYSPTSFQVGLFTSIISAALLVFLFGVWLWRLLMGANDEHSTTVSRVARNSAAPILLNLFNRGIIDMAFALVMLRILGPEDAGIYYYAIVIFVWFDIFTNFGLDVFLIREAARQRDQARHFFLNTTFFRVFLMFVCTPLLLGFLFIRQSFIADPLPARGLLAIGLLYVGLAPGSINKGLTSLFYAFEKAEYPAAVTTVTTVNRAVFGLIALLLGYGIVGLAVVSILANMITLAILLWEGRRLVTLTPRPPLSATEKPVSELPFSKEARQRLAGLRVKPDYALMRNMVSESWPLMLNHFLATIFFQIDIVILEAIKGARIVGKYSTAYKWLLAINIIPAFFTQALLPVMSRQANEDRAALKRTYTLGVKLLVYLAMPLAVVFTFLADGLTLVLGGSQYMPEGAIALQIMIWSIPIGWINSLTQYALVAVDLQRYITRAFIIAVAFNVVTNLIFIPHYGYQAAAVTTIFSELVLLIPFAFLLQGALGKLAWLDMVWRAGVAGGFMAAVMFAGWHAVPALVVLLSPAMYTGVLLLLKPLNAGERAMLMPLLPARFKRIAAEAT